MSPARGLGVVVGIAPLQYLSMSDRYLYHLTLNSGHTRKSYRAEISDDALRVCAELISQIEAEPGMRVEMPGPLGYEITGLISGQCMSAQVFAVGQELPLVSIAIAARERCGAALWQQLGGEEGKQPDAPWLAAKLEIGLATLDPAMHWLGDFERCLGWAFLESLVDNG
jgi:hypothetical protein